jgi:hypothetical protein
MLLVQSGRQPLSNEELSKRIARQEIGNPAAWRTWSAYQRYRRSCAAIISSPAPTVKRRNPTNGLRKRALFRSRSAHSRMTVRTYSCDGRNACKASSRLVRDAGMIFFGARSFLFGGGSSVRMKKRLNHAG